MMMLATRIAVLQAGRVTGRGQTFASGQDVLLPPGFATLPQVLASLPPQTDLAPDAGCRIAFAPGSVVLFDSAAGRRTDPAA